MQRDRALAILRDNIAHNPQKWDIDQPNPHHLLSGLRFAAFSLLTATIFLANCENVG